MEGSLQAFATLKPALDQIDPTLVPQIATTFDALVAVLDSYRDPSGARRLDALRPADRRGQEGLTDALLVVQEPLSAISAKITN